MRTYDYILAMREENQTADLDPFDDSDADSDESSNFSSPEKPSFVSQFICRGGQRLNQVGKEVDENDFLLLFMILYGGPQSY